MRTIGPMVIGVALGACTSNTITIDSDDDGTSAEPEVEVTTTPPGPTTTTTTGPMMTAGVTTTPPPPVTTTPPDETGGDPLDMGTIECVPPCAPDQVCVQGVCFDDPGSTTGDGCWDPDGPPGIWGDCLLDDGTTDPSACANEGELCVVDAMPPTVGVCLTHDCADECDCPAPPDTGDALVTCAELIGDGFASCFLSCDAGQACPDGMVCFGGFVCMYPQP